MRVGGIEADGIEGRSNTLLFDSRASKHDVDRECEGDLASALALDGVFFVTVGDAGVRVRIGCFSSCRALRARYK
jgi:hypothetical protein